MSGLIPIVAFCAMMEIPTCLYMENTTEYAFKSQTACEIQTSRMRSDPETLKTASKAFYDGYGYIGPLQYASYCIPEGGVEAFYTEMGVQRSETPED